jgi:hypothetical protein
MEAAAEQPDRAPGEQYNLTVQTANGARVQQWWRACECFGHRVSARFDELLPNRFLSIFKIRHRQQQLSFIQSTLSQLLMVAVRDV